MIHALLIIGSFLFMEFVAWSNHKYVMHGFLWSWHKDHHVNDHKKMKSMDEIRVNGFEQNDLFFLFYALPAIALMITGLSIENYYFVSISVGITVYGFIYFLIHDVMIHERLNIPFLIHADGKYIRALKAAHQAHHRGKDIKDFNNYGLLVFQLRFLKQEFSGKRNGG